MLHEKRKTFTMFVVSSLSSAVNTSCLLISSILIKDRVLIKYWNETASIYSWSPAKKNQHRIIKQMIATLEQWPTLAFFLIKFVCESILTLLAESENHNPEITLKSYLT